MVVTQKITKVKIDELADLVLGSIPIKDLGIIKVSAEDRTVYFQTIDAFLPMGKYKKSKIPRNKTEFVIPGKEIVEYLKQISWLPNDLEYSINEHGILRPRITLTSMQQEQHPGKKLYDWEKERIARYEITIREETHQGRI